MVEHVCEKCEKVFKQKSQLDAHKNRKNPCKKDGAIEKIVEKKVQEVLARMNVVVPTIPSSSSAPLKFIDLFCGIGGFHQALASLGATCVLACDIDEKCREVYKNNYGIEPKHDVTTLVSSDIPDFDILCAGFPCQAFSHAGKQDGFEDTRGTLFRDICRILREKKPRYFLLENVKNLRGHDKGNTWKTIYRCLVDSGYSTYETPIVLSPHQLGIPQHRERVMIMGWRNDILPAAGLPVIQPITTPSNVNIQSVLLDDADIPEGTALNNTDVEVLTLWETFIQHFKSNNIKLPTFPIWSDDWDSSYDVKEALDNNSDEFDNDESVELDNTVSYKFPEWKQKFVLQNRAFYSEHKEFLGAWIATARNHPAFVGSRRKLEWQAGKFHNDDSIWKLLFQFRPSGIRVKRANYSPALVAMAQIVYVGEKRRKLCPREVARLQSFPDSFKLPSSAASAYKQFGNSVNVEVIKYAARILLGLHST
jgi:DNA (cytosine-5)-methyltransferase 1